MAFARSRGGHLISTTDIPQVWDFVPLGVFQILVVLTKMKNYIYLKDKHICHQPPNFTQRCPWQSLTGSSSAPQLSDACRHREGRKAQMSAFQRSSKPKPFELILAFHTWRLFHFCILTPGLVSPIEELGNSSIQGCLNRRLCLPLKVLDFPDEEADGNFYLKYWC